MSTVKTATTAMSPPKPRDTSDLVKIAAATAAEVVKRYDPSEEAAELLTEDMTPSVFLDYLFAQELVEDAITFLAYALPRREALLWGVRCMREITLDESEEVIAAAIAAADAWVSEPGDEARRKAFDAAEAATYETPAGCLALAVFFSEGSMAPADCPDVPVGEGFCARTVAAAIHVGSLIQDPDQAHETALTFADLGLEVASEPAPWEDPLDRTG